MSETAYIEFRTHACTIIRTDEDIRCFKFAGPRSNLRCDYQTFSNQEDATEYIVEPFPLDWWQLTIPE